MSMIRAMTQMQKQIDRLEEKKIKIANKAELDTGIIQIEINHITKVLNDLKKAPDDGKVQSIREVEQAGDDASLSEQPQAAVGSKRI